MIIRWMPKCHEEIYAFGLWGAQPTQMLNGYALAVYHQLTVMQTSVNLALPRRASQVSIKAGSTDK
jgi:hypothetical protein